MRRSSKAEINRITNLCLALAIALAEMPLVHAENNKAATNSHKAAHKTKKSTRKKIKAGAPHHKKVLVRPISYPRTNFLPFGFLPEARSQNAVLQSSPAQKKSRELSSLLDQVPPEGAKKVNAGKANLCAGEAAAKAGSAKIASAKAPGASVSANNVPLPADMVAAGKHSGDEVPAHKVPVGVPVDKVSVDRVPVDKVSVDRVPVDKVPVDKVPVNKVPVDKVPVDKVPVDKVSVDKALSANQKSKEKQTQQKGSDDLLQLQSDTRGFDLKSASTGSSLPILEKAPSARGNALASSIMDKISTVKPPAINLLSFSISPLSVLIFLVMATFWLTMIFRALCGSRDKGMRSRLSPEDQELEK